jgi:hypothetical protein
VNAAPLIATIRALGAQSVCLDHGEASHPIRVTAVGAADPGFALIMPMQLPEEP